MTSDSRPYHHGNLREALIRAGIALLEEEGLDALSLRAIAARAGVSHAAPRNHFATLRDLQTAIATEAFRLHAAAMRAGLPPGAPRDARRRAAMEGYVRFAREHPALYALMFSIRPPDLADPGLLAAASESYAVLADVARGLLPERPDLPDAQKRAETMLWSLAHGFAQLSGTGLIGGPAGTPPLGIADIMPDIGTGG